jgi:FG-GAP repeat
MARSIRVAVLAALLLAAVPAGAATGAAGGTGLAAAVQAGPAALADFNGDGIDDLVVGVPGEDIGGTANAGVVDVIYGSESGLPDGPRQQLTQALPEPGDGFGTAVVTGDFNGDILTDLAVGAPGENIGAIADAGAVEVFYGSGGVIGLSATPDQLLRQGAGGMAGTAEAGDRFGSALGTADFDGNDADNLVIGSPARTWGPSPSPTPAR